MSHIFDLEASASAALYVAHSHFPSLLIRHSSATSIELSRITVLPSRDLLPSSILVAHQAYNHSVLLSAMRAMRQFLPFPPQRCMGLPSTSKAACSKRVLLILFSVGSSLFGWA